MDSRQLGHYRLEGLLGRGGMGEVHRATDTRLAREVAVKLLPPALADDAERLARFEREARVLASLNHPNIAQIFDVETAGEDKFLVMELAAGEDLSERIARGAIPWPDAHRIAGQIAAGLVEAHEKGIVHRDLKPQNVKVTPDGNVKILDFGLARAVEETGQADLTQSPTITAAMTGQGVVLGTAAYMSPEQARGLEADRRADVWAFGVLLYEMLTGQRLFRGDTVSDTIAAVLTRDPEWDDLPVDLPAPTQYLLRRSLVRDRDRRLRDLGEAAALLTDPDATSSFRALVDEEPEPTPADRRSNWPVWVLAAVAMAMAALWLTSRTQIPPPPQYVTGMGRVTYQATLPDSPSLSPDGSLVAYEDIRDGQADIFLQRIGGTRPINLTEGSPADDFAPSFSPDGNHIAFTSDREDGPGVYVMGATGEATRLVAPGGSYPSWSPDSNSLVYTTEAFFSPYGRTETSEIWTVPASGGPPQRIFEGDAVQATWSPRGDWLAFWSVNTATGGRRDIAVIRPDGSDHTLVTDDDAVDWSPQWAADGRSIYHLSDRGGSMNLWRIPFDPDAGVATGPPVAVTLPASVVQGVSIAREGGTLVFASRSSSAVWRKVPFDREAVRIEGNGERLPLGSFPAVVPRLSPDGTAVAYLRREFQEDVVVASLDGDDLRLLLNDPARDRGPSWSPDGERILFYSDRAGRYEVFSIRQDGSDLRQLTRTPGSGRGTVWYPKVADSGRWMAGTGEAGTALYPRVDDGWGEPERLVLPGFPGWMFQHWSWAPGKDRLLGAAIPRFGAPGPVLIWDAEAGEWIRTEVETGGSVLDWVDRDRFVYSPDRFSVRAHDLRTGEDWEVLDSTEARDLTSLLIPKEGDWVLLHSNVTTSDLWSASLVSTETR